MSLLRLVVLLVSLLVGQHTAVTHGYSHVSPHADSVAAAQFQAPDGDGDPLDAAEDFCALCVACDGSPGAPPTASMGSSPSVPAVAAHFAVAPAPTFPRLAAFAPRAPPVLLT